MTQTSDPFFAGLPSSADDQQLSKSSTNDRDLEIHLRAAEERYRGLAEQVLDGIFIADSQGHYLDANRAGCEMLGYTLDELKTLMIPEVLAPDELPRLAEQFRRLATRQIIRNEWCMRRKDGSIFVGELVGRQLPNGCVQGVLRDITERKRAEDARFRHATIVESSRDAIICKNLDAVITSWNGGAQRIFGYWEEEVVGQPITILIPPELWDEEKEILEKLKAGGHIEHYETIRFTKTGQKVDVSLSISPLKDSTGRIVGFCKTAHDITSRKRTEAALRASEGRLRLAQWAAHIGTFDLDLRTGEDIWTPETEALYGLPPGGFGGTLTAFENLIHPADRERIIELTRAMIETGQPAEAEWRAVWPDGSVHWIAGRAQVFMGESGEPSRMLGVNMDITERQVMVVEFKSSGSLNSLPPEISLCLFRVLQEALHNAAKHSGVKRVDVQLREESGEIHLIVSDSGAGFEVATAMEGQGLGLTGMRERARLVGGTIAIDSKPLNGTTIHVRVPFRTERDFQVAAG